MRSGNCSRDTALTVTVEVKAMSLIANTAISCSTHVGLVHPKKSAQQLRSSAPKMGQSVGITDVAARGGVVNGTLICPAMLY